MRITMEDTKSGNKTVIELSKVRVNQGITDDLFSRRTLLRG
jgi:outer membrane lipoprotein-sorting protein